jgi:hypothetical protein
MGQMQPIQNNQAGHALIHSELIQTMKNLASKSLTFFENISQRAHLKTLGYLLEKMAVQRKKLLGTLEQYQSQQNLFVQNSLNRGSTQSARSPLSANENSNRADEIILWYSRNHDRDLNNRTEDFINDLESNERQFLSFYRSRIKYLKDYKLASVLASNVAAIQITYDKLRVTRLKSGSSKQ